ncbi:hypothetical protein GGQ21_003128 [Salinibacter ruber]|uniref:hypothetical protein n=1 Tax=Salinibacter ruber TaxID=146919 RepID=UPI00161F9AD8|nr:hypothetical protein [Salinibacter ruber]MBB4062724.1 hypothetical protein [Salinibacter ruber]MCS3672458.1 hypothetical protein [Salinibacter ruber]MCS3863230.1 hypothetical protein [Salinibacter ruber]MCS4116337.1 hypothetical protein [Salinibacter ruber]MCS4174874.1 hypothetical protein [Salinibacter ruber]
MSFLLRLLLRACRAAARIRPQAASLLWLAGTVCAAVAVSTSAQAQSPRAERTVRLQIRPNTTLRVQGTPALTLPAPGQPAETPDGAATYALTTNTGAPKEIRASLDEALPLGLSLEVKVGAPESRGRGATSDGWKALRPSAERVVHDIQKSSDSGVPITYRAVATAQAAPEDYRVTVTYTITGSN